MKKILITLLALFAILSLVLLFWPFAEWSDVMSVILRLVPAFSIQMLLCIVCGLTFVTITPVLITGGVATWGTYLYFTSSHWNNATIGGLIADYISPFIICTIVLLVYTRIKKKQIR